MAPARISPYAVLAGDRRPLVVKHEKITPGILWSFPYPVRCHVHVAVESKLRFNPLDDVLCRLVPCSGILPCFCVLLVSTAWLSSAQCACGLDGYVSHSQPLLRITAFIRWPWPSFLARPLATVFFFCLQSTYITVW